MIARAARRVLSGTAAAVDRAVLSTIYATRGQSPELGHRQKLELLEGCARLYADCAPLFRAPRAIQPDVRAVRTGREPGVYDLAWPSAFVPHCEEVRPTYDRSAANRIAACRLYLHPEPRPIAVVLHGYMSGHYGFEERAWPLRGLYASGLDLALFVLPFHGLRGEGWLGTPPFPGPDPRIGNEGFRQALADLGDLKAWLSSRGHPAVGLMGMSLGAYTASLGATVFGDLAFLIGTIPLASIADFARERGRLGRDPVLANELYRALDRAYRPTSPLHRPPQIAGDRVLLLAAEADRITPVSHARRLARHFDARLEILPGSHLLQLGRAAGLRHTRAFLAGLGICRA